MHQSLSETDSDFFGLQSQTESRGVIRNSDPGKDHLFVSYLGQTRDSLSVLLITDQQHIMVGRYQLLILAAVSMGEHSWLTHLSSSKERGKNADKTERKYCNINQQSLMRKKS